MKKKTVVFVLSILSIVLVPSIVVSSVHRNQFFSYATATQGEVSEKAKELSEKIGIELSLSVIKHKRLLDRYDDIIVHSGVSENQNFENGTRLNSTGGLSSNTVDVYTSSLETPRFYLNYALIRGLSEDYYSQEIVWQIRWKKRQLFTKQRDIWISESSVKWANSLETNTGAPQKLVLYYGNADLWVEKNLVLPRTDFYPKIVTPLDKGKKFANNTVTQLWGECSCEKTPVDGALLLRLGLNFGKGQTSYDYYSVDYFLESVQK